MIKSEPRPPVGPGAEVGSVDWARLLAENDRWLRTVVAVRLGEPQAIDEVMQEVALAAIRQRAPLVDREKAAPWLYRLAVRQTLLYRRKHGRRRKLIERVARRNQPREGDNRDPDPLAWLLAEERRHQVRQAVARLGRHDAEILMLKYIEQWSYRELADHLGISESAVEARLHRARQRLRSELTALNLVSVDG